MQVTACTDVARAAIEAAGGSVTRVYYTAEGLRALIQVCAMAALYAHS